MTVVEKHVNPFTDYGFKHLFGEEPNKDLLIDFLNELLREEQGEITDLQYLKSEQLGNTDLDRKAIFDLYCTTSQGERFIVELQKSKQKFFKDRSLYYATFPIQEQAKQGDDWNFKFDPIYTIAILDFVFDDDKDETDKYRYEGSLKYYRDLKNSIDTAREEGVEAGFKEGLEKGRLTQQRQIAAKMKASGFDEQGITQITGLTTEEIEKL